MPLKLNVRGEGWMEKDADRIWLTLCSMTRSILLEGKFSPESLLGVAVTAARQCVVPVDDKGTILRDAILWGTKATWRQAQFMEERVSSQRIHQITTRPINPVWAVPSILYILQEEPRIAQRTYKILELEDIVLYKLGSDDFVGDHSQSGAIGIYDIFRRQWSRELCDALEIPFSLLPHLVEAGTIVGHVSREASSLSGLPEGLPIIAGGGDCQTSAIGCGVIRPGLANVAVGTSGVASMYVERPVIEAHSRFVCTPHSIPGAYVVDNNTLSGGVSYKWFAENICEYRDSEDKYELLNQLLRKVPVGSSGVLFMPHLLGSACPYWDAQAKGVFVGMTLNTGRGEMARAVVEGSCMEIAKGFVSFEEQGFPLQEIIACGGACRRDSPWNQIQADIYGKPVRTTTLSENTALGCAMLITVATGYYPTLEEAAAQMVRYDALYQPDPQNHCKYRRLMKIHDEVYSALKAAGVYSDIFREVQET